MAKNTLAALTNSALFASKGLIDASAVISDKRRNRILMTIHEYESFLETEIFTIDGMFDLYIQVFNARCDYVRIFNIAPSFFQLVTQAFLQNSTMRLCRLYDRSKDAVTLEKYLNKLQSEPDANREMQDSINKAVNKCKSVTQALNVKITKLRELRDSYLAHNDPEGCVSNYYASVGLLIADYHELIGHAAMIMNIIREAQNRSPVVFAATNKDDFSNVLEALIQYTTEHPDYFEAVDRIQRKKEQAFIIQYAVSVQQHATVERNAAK